MQKYICILYINYIYGMLIRISSYFRIPFLTKEFGLYFLLSQSNFKPHCSSLNDSFQLNVKDFFYLTIGHQLKFLEHCHSPFSILSTINTRLLVKKA